MRNGTKLMRKETVTCRFNEMLVLGFRHRFSHLLTMYALLTKLELVDGFEQLWRQNGQKSLKIAENPHNVGIHGAQVSFAQKAFPIIHICVHFIRCAFTRTHLRRASAEET